MTWLLHSDDEVTVFHPAFRTLGDQVLANLGISAEYEWQHHPLSPHSAVIPDFVLVHISTGRWILVVEIKRRPASVESERNQIQAKGYVEANSGFFRPTFPGYFLLTNLELTQLFAARPGLSPRECKVESMVFVAGQFSSTAAIAHQAKYSVQLQQIVEFVLREQAPNFLVLWSSIAQELYQYSTAVVYSRSIDPLRGTVSPEVNTYFSGDVELPPRRELLLRCLLTEFIFGVLLKFGHPDASRARPPARSITSFANAASVLSSIDFSGVITANDINIYVREAANPTIRSIVDGYLGALAARNVRGIVQSRDDAMSLLDALIEEWAPSSERDSRGKAATDSELADLLAGFCISDINQRILDPGCGEGNLLSAAYDLLIDAGATRVQALRQISGWEVDSVAARIAALRLSLKEPRTVAAADRCGIRVHDMFAGGSELDEADVVLINPPFKRYEAQDDAPIPAQLRAYFRNAILSSFGEVSLDAGQANIYVYYAEFVIRSVKQDATIGIILDNKWYHNESSRVLREFLLRQCEILAVVEYPHGRYFRGLMIATSMLIIRKRNPTTGHRVRFIRLLDPSSVTSGIIRAVFSGGSVPSDWQVREVLQSDLNAETWKEYLSGSLVHEFRVAPLVLLPHLYRFGRRGSLAKEGGGIAVYEFPQRRTQYGPRRLLRVGGGPYQTLNGRALTNSENRQLAALSQSIPDSFLGYAINKADRLTSYRLNVADVSVDRTIEAPRQRRAPLVRRYDSPQRVVWDADLDAAVSDIRADPHLGRYVNEVENVVGLDEGVLSRSEIWNALREPYAGELIIPRKQRVGHRVHINAFAFGTGRQVRLSSNFLSYSHCLAVDSSTGLTREIANTLVAAWLTSSFGHYQFEIESNNREGARSVEQYHVEKLWVLDPRIIRASRRQAIIDAFDALPYPVRTDLRPDLQPELRRLDELFAAEVVAAIPSLNDIQMLSELWDALAELHESRAS